MTSSDFTLLNDLMAALMLIEGRSPVAPVLSPDEIYASVNLELEAEGLSDKGLVNTMSKVFEYTPKTTTSLFFNQLFGGRQPKALIGDMLACMLNNSMYTYKVGGPMVLIEKKILEKIAELIGYKNDHLGTFAPGGSMTNYMGMLMARDNYKKEITLTGNTEGMVMYTSKISHYSIPKNASMMGVGRNAVRFIDTDDRGCMDLVKLKAAIDNDIESGLKPFCVIATAGTTVLGAFDNIEGIADITEQYNKIWLHVDGAYCGSVLWSEKYKHLINGSNRCDSFSVNAHKMLGVPLSCSMIVTKHPQALYDSFSNEASYLYQTDDDNLNPGKISIQCGRRNDALKFFMLWKSIGSDGLRSLVDHQFHLADVARQYIRSNSDYTLYSFDESVGICFNYKDVDPEVLCSRLYEESELVVGYGSHNGQVFVRLVTINGTNNESDILLFFEKMEAFVKDGKV